MNPMAGGKHHGKTSFPFWKSERDPSVQEDAPSIPWLDSYLSGWDQKPGFNADITSSPSHSFMGNLSGSLQSRTLTFRKKNALIVFLFSYEISSQIES